MKFNRTSHAAATDFQVVDTDAMMEQNLLLQFIYQCPVGLAKVDDSGKVTLLNELGVALLLPVAGEIGLNNFFDILRPSAPDLIELIQASPSVGEICRDRHISFARAADCIQLSFTVLRLDINALMVAFKDVTGIVEAENAARDALEEKALQSGRAEMASTVLHDIGNAIVGIGTRSSQLLSEPPWPETENLARINSLLQAQSNQLAPVLGERKAAALVGLAGELESGLRDRENTLREHVRSLVNSVSHIQDILSVQRQYALQRSGPRNRVGLVELINDSLALHASTLEKRQIQVVRRLAGDLPHLSLDRTRMIQVLSNLIKNAAESFEGLDENHPRRLEIIAENKGEGWVTLVVKDSGCGFPPKYGDAFFERGTTTKPQGTGLGLSGSRSTLEAHGGSIRIESEGVGKGASVIIDLPPPSDGETDV